MKNQIIKKIMAYLLVGAMVITTPMTASANELENAYATGTDLDTENTSGSNTNTNSSTNTIATEIPDVIEKYDLNITGIALDKDAMNFNEVSTDEKLVSGTLQARVLFDDYDPADEPMVWTSIDYDTKKEIEEKIHWYSNNNDVAKAVWAKNDPKKATIKAVGIGQAEVSVWIEADGIAYAENLDRPTPGDYIATAVITVTEETTKIEYQQNGTKFYQKRTYNLKDYTTLNGHIPATSAGAEELIYSLVDVSKGSKVTLSQDGTLNVKKATASTTASFNVTTASGSAKLENVSIEFGNTIPATKVELSKTKLDFDLGGDVPNDSEIVTAKLINAKGKNIIAEVTVDTPDSERESKITDIVTWTSKNSKIVDTEAVEGKSDLTRKIVAKGVGSTTITATATSGKKATIKVTVAATPTGVKIVDIKGETNGSTYTGKRTTLTAVLTAKNGEIELPVGKTKFKWAPSDKKVATVSGKAIGTVKPANLVQSGDTKEKNVTISVRAYNGKKYDVSGKYTLTVKQSNVSDIEIAKIDGTEKNNYKTIVAFKTKKKGTDKAFLGTSSEYIANVAADSKEYEDSIGWTISGSAAAIDDNGKLVPVKAGKATVSANYVTINSKGKAKLNKKTVSVTVVQNATEIAFAKAETVKNVSAKDQTVTLKVKTIAPKKATCNVADWKVLAYITNPDGTFTDTGDKSVKPKGVGTYITKCTNNSVKVKIPANAQPGSVIKVGAYTDGGVVAYAYIYITEKTSKVKAENPTLSVDYGKTKPIGKVNVVFKDKSEEEAGKKNLSFGTQGTDGSTTAFITEPVTYSLDKNSAKYIRIDQNGNITGIQKTGKKTATVTIKTISGKSAKVKVTVQ